MKDLDEFKEFRKKMNERIFSYGNKQINRFFSLDSQSYREGALSEKVKELLGLATSTVLRCEDCITYHIIRAVQVGCTDDEIIEALEIALIVGGSIVIPELRRAVSTLEDLRERQKKGLSIDELV
ncbi:MAG: carboxymuconolactone decarboxylase family protein [Candidatus Heimdallarchaeum aukensis]|uniref:Carboxymuconolactone decarboxylase family protein n=1 Tax=Candidatus Heimdallarchaeum aukensis TaxID=2876573 RepID=A0A9Y1BM86_9ARCH|nr:MAG: carboxymuconolactone decarboxylase family protein [Candidatus Heimdallarchaeum aukensis]